MNTNLMSSLKAFLMISLLAVSLNASSQEGMHGSTPRMIHGIGASFQSFDGLNERIKGFPQYEQLKDRSAVLQLGWQTEKRRFISALDLTSGSSMSGDPEEKSSSVRFLGASTDIGYDLLKSEKVMLYPLVGVGFETYQARFFTDNSEVSFNNIIGTPAVQSEIAPVKFRNNFFNYRLGAGVQFKCTKSSSHSIGLQGGYTGSFKDKAWRSNDSQKLKDSPEDRIGRFYVSLIFGYLPKFKH
ncbi:MAG: hypothetical protein H7Y03_02750 [Chitinophagaceae bacterium]|nr:hypothetical protein [Chitinophagaceae bacterium]